MVGFEWSWMILKSTASSYPVFLRYRTISPVTLLHHQTITNMDNIDHLKMFPNFFSTGKLVNILRYTRVRSEERKWHMYYKTHFIPAAEMKWPEQQATMSVYQLIPEITFNRNAHTNPSSFAPFSTIAILSNCQVLRKPRQENYENSLHHKASNGFSMIYEVVQGNNTEIGFRHQNTRKKWNIIFFTLSNHFCH